MVRALFYSLLFFWLIFFVVCNQFYGGTITWCPLNASAIGTPVAILITQTYIWSYPLMPCTPSMIASNQLVSNYSGLATKKLQCISNCGNGSLGYSNLDVIPYCIGSSLAFSTSISQRSDIVNLTSGDDFSVAYQDSSWHALATGSNASWSLTSRINVKPRSDNGLYNNAPVSTVMSPTYIPANKTTVINIPVSDADGDILRCRWANSSNGVNECSSICPPSSLPPATVLYPNCTIVITDQNVSSWYAVAVMVEDFINSSSTTPLSSVPVQFLVQTVTPPSCPYLPVVVETPLTGSCKVLIVNQTYTFQLITTSYCGSNVSIVDILLQAFSGITQSNVTQLNSTTFYKNIIWTSSSTHTGYQTLCALAINSQGSQSSPYCLNFYVSTYSLCSCPNEPCSTTTTTTTTTSSTSATKPTSTSTTSSTGSTITSTTSISVSTTSTTSLTQTTSTSTTSKTTTSSTRSTTTSTTSTSVSTTSTISMTQTTSTSTTSRTTTSFTSSTTTSTTSTSVSTTSTTSVIQSTTTSTTSLTNTTSKATTTTHMTTTSTYAYVSFSSTTSSTTANTTAMSTLPITDSISSSEPADANLYKWLVIGSIVGIPLLLTLILGSCLCWYYCSPCGIGRIKLSDCQGSFEFYHFDLGMESESNDRRDQYSMNRVLSESDNDSLILQNNIDATESVTLDVSNRLSIRRREKEQFFNDEYTNSIVESKPFPKLKRENSLKEHHRPRTKPKRVTIISLPPSTSQSTLDYPYIIPNYRLMNQTPDYERNINNVHVKHVRWPQRWTRNKHRPPQFDSID